jgi:hypothetical protein
MISRVEWKLSWKYITLWIGIEILMKFTGHKWGDEKFAAEAKGEGGDVQQAEISSHEE